MSDLVLSLFPGIGLLDMAFEEEGFTVVRGPDLLWGGNIKTFHPPAGRFDGVIGGPPCKGESTLAHLNGSSGASLANEFRRVCAESEAAWWVMEAVKPHVANHSERACQCSVTPCPCFCHSVDPLLLNNRWFGEAQSRKRYFHSNLYLRPYVSGMAVFENRERKHAVLAVHGGAVGSIQRGMAKYSLVDACKLQGLPADFTDGMPFTKQWKYEVVGNGVPLPMGRAIAKAVREARTRSMTTRPTRVELLARIDSPAAQKPKGEVRKEE